MFPIDAHEEQELELLEGTVSAVVYQNPENGYTVLRVKSREGSQTVVGEMAQVAVGEEITAAGRWVDHPSFGPQFAAESIELSMPQERDAIFAYLSSGAIKGVGKRTAQRIVTAFGPETLIVIETDPDRLAQVPGITPKKARAIQAGFLQKAGLRRLVEFLTLHGLPVTLGMALWRQYADRAIELIQTEPYLLLEGDFGLRFAEVDRLASECGVPPEAPQRLEAALLYTLTHNLGNGHCFLPRDKLLPAAARLLGLELPPPLDAALSRLETQGKVVRCPVANVDAVYRADLFRAESEIVSRIAAMCTRELLPPEGIESLIDRVQREQGVTYAAQQREAVRTAASRQILLLTGGPGTGKTTSLRGILGLFEAMGLKTLLAAPTGRAAKRLGELCGTEASTIHRLLEAGYDPESGQLAFCRDAEEPLEADAVIVDETSMVDVPLMAALLDALPGDCRLVLVGDPDQLPSVGPGQVFQHLIRSGAVPTVCLTEIFRQARTSQIVMNAHSINEGVLPSLQNRGGDFFFLRRRDPQRAVETIVELCKTRLPQRMGIPADQIQVLSPTRKYLTGTANLNLELQAALNPPVPGQSEAKRGGFSFRTGDRVMQIKNNYNVLWRSRDRQKGGTGVFNGDVGVIEHIAPGGELVTVCFDDHVVEYSQDMLSELEPAYAMTVHKSQGSEYRAVILAALNGASMLLTRGVLYTAVTRAKELLIIVGDDEILASMTANDRQTRRYSGIRAMLCEETGAPG